MLTLPVFCGSHLQWKVRYIQAELSAVQKRDPTSIAGSTPMEIEIGNGLFNSVARSAIAPICLLPAVKK